MTTQHLANVTPPELTLSITDSSEGPIHIGHLLPNFEQRLAEMVTNAAVVVEPDEVHLELTTQQAKQRDLPAIPALMENNLARKGVWANDPVPLYPYPSSPDYRRLFGLPDDAAWERAHAH